MADDELRQEKLTVGKAFEAPIHIAWTPRAVPVPDGQGGAVAVQAAVYGADDESLLACFKAAAEAGQSVPSAATGPCTTWHVLSAYAELKKPIKDNKTRFREGIVRLLRTGLIRTEDYRDNHRSPRTRLVLVGLDDAPVCGSSEPPQNNHEPTHPCGGSPAKGCGGEPQHPDCRTRTAAEPTPGQAGDDCPDVPADYCLPTDADRAEVTL